MFVLSRALIGVLRAAVLEEQPFFNSRPFEDELVRLVLAYLGSVTKAAVTRLDGDEALLGRRQRHVQQHAELVGEIAAHPRMHLPCLSKKRPVGVTGKTPSCQMPGWM